MTFPLRYKERLHAHEASHRSYSPYQYPNLLSPPVLLSLSLSLSQSPSLSLSSFIHLLSKIAVVVDKVSRLNIKEQRK
jgi:hypothetical protein